MVIPFRRARGTQFRFAVGAVVCSTAVALTSALCAPWVSAQEASDQASVAGLVSAVAKAQADVDALQLDMGNLQERANRAFVDLRDAQARAEQARRGAAAAAERLHAAQADVDAARADLDSFSRAQYRGTGAARFSALAEDASQKDALDRAQFIHSGAADKRAALESVERARTEAANEQSIARQALELAESSEAAAQQAETDARNVVDESSAALAERSAELEAAQSALADAEASLAEARPESVPQETVEEERVDTFDPASVAQEDIEDVTRRVVELAPEAPAPAPENVAQAIATAQAAQAEDSAAPQLTEDVLAQAAGIAAAAALVGSSQLPHATFQDPYAGPVAGGGSSSRGESRVATDYNAREIVSAFAGGLQQGVSMATGQAQLPTQSGEQTADASEAAEVPEAVAEVPEAVAEVLPEVETAESTTEDVQEAVSQVAATANASQVETVIARAEAMVGTPYVWGGGDANGPTTGLNGGSVKGFDCSGLVLYAFAGAGVSLPHYTGYQYQRGTKIDPSDAQRGDLLFWGPGGNQHVAIYLGDGMMIEAPQSGQNVSIVPVRWSNMSEHAVRLL